MATDEAPASADSGDDELAGLASVVLVDRHDDLAAVCGRVDAAPTFAVVIHAPRGNQQLASDLGMRRLVRHASDGARVVAIATGNGALASRARRAGVPVARKPEQVRWDSGGRRVLRLGRVSIAIPRFGGLLTPVTITVLIAAVMAALGLTVGPSATVRLSPPTETVSQEVTIEASPGRTSIDVAALKLPAGQVSVTRQITLAVRTTGRLATAAAGGTAADRAIVDAKDIEALNGLARDLAKVDAIKAMAAAGRPGDVVFLETATATAVPGPVVPSLGSYADIAVMQVDVTVTATAVLASTLQELGAGLLRAPRPGATLVPGSVVAIQTGAAAVSRDTAAVTAALRVTGQFAISFSEDDIREAVKGASSDDAESILKERYGSSDPTVEISPGWAPWLPRFGFRINVEFRPPGQAGALASTAVTNDRPATTVAPTPSPAPRP